MMMHGGSTMPRTLTVNEREIRYVDTSGELNDFISVAGDEHELAVDLEADSLHHYQDRICLIQISTASVDWIIDIQSDMDFSPLWRLLENPNMVHIFHDADFDLRSLDRDFGIHVRRIFDTKIAAELLGRRQLGLSAVLESLLGIKLRKKFQKYNWSRRPLDPDAMIYAAMDTRFLFDIKRNFSTELKRLNRDSWATEEFLYLETCRWQPSRRDRLKFWKIAGVGSLKPGELEIMRRVWWIRESEAKRRDVPVFKVFSDRCLFSLASKALENSDIQGLVAASGIPRGLRKKVIGAIDIAAATPVEKCPRPPAELTAKEPPFHSARFRALKKSRDIAARRYGLDPGVIAGNKTLKTIAAIHLSDDALSFDRIVRTVPLRRWQAEMLNIL